MWLAQRRVSATSKLPPTPLRPISSMDELLVCRLRGRGDFQRRPLHSGQTSKLSGTGREFTGRMLMKTLAWKVCFMACRRVVRAHSLIFSEQGVNEMANHLTRVWSGRAGCAAQPQSVRQPGSVRHFGSSLHPRLPLPSPLAARSEGSLRGRISRSGE